MIWRHATLLYRELGSFEHPRTLAPQSANAWGPDSGKGPAAAQPPRIQRRDSGRRGADAPSAPVLIQRRVDGGDLSSIALGSPFTPGNCDEPRLSCCTNRCRVLRRHGAQNLRGTRAVSCLRLSAAVCFPTTMFGWHAFAAGPESSSDCGRLVGKEHAKGDVVSARDPSQRILTIQPSVDSCSPSAVAAKRALFKGLVRRPVFAHKRIYLRIGVAQFSSLHEKAIRWPQ